MFTEVCAELLLVSVYGDRPAGGCVLSEKKPRPRGAEAEAEGAESAEAKTAFSLLGWATYSQVRKVGTS